MPGEPQEAREFKRRSSASGEAGLSTTSRSRRSISERRDTPCKPAKRGVQGACGNRNPPKGSDECESRKPKAESRKPKAAISPVRMPAVEGREEVKKFCESS
jgi:hypothetical protein